MSLEKASVGWSAKQLKVMIGNGKVNFDHIVQRSYVWERERKSHLIESMIIGYPIPPIYAKRKADGSGQRGNAIYYIMDGKQRLNTIKEYLNDEFALTSLPIVTYLDEETNTECKVDVSGLKFSELPEALRDYLNTVMLTVTYFDNLTKEEERELFRRLNAGKPLSVKNKVLAACKDLEKLLDIGEHPVFKDMLTSKAIDNKNQVALIMKMWCMLNMDINDVSFEGKEFNPILESTIISSTEETDLRNVLDAIADIRQILIKDKNKNAAKWFLKETHLISLIPFIKKGLNNHSKEEMADFVNEFYYEVCRSGSMLIEAYTTACNTATAKNKNIKIRNNAIEDFYNNYF